MSTTYLSAPALARPDAQEYSDRLTVTGIILFVTGILVIASGFGRFRPEIAGLKLHPYLIPIALLFPSMLLSRIQQFPARVLGGLAVFGGIYVAAALNGAGGLSETFKILSAGMVIVGSALFVQRHSDFVAGTLGLNLAVAALAVHGLSEYENVSVGFKGLDVANKNSYSLYALPAMLLAGYVILQMPKTKKPIKVLLGLCAMASLAAIFMSGNRSGYLGALVVGIMLLASRKAKGILLVAAVAGAVVFYIANYGSTVVLSRRLEQTAEGTESDRLRRDLIGTCIKIAIENPILGASPQGLPLAIGRHLQTEYRHDIIDPHNVFAHVLGGCGIICFGFLIFTGISLWQYGKPIKNREADREYPDLGRLLRMMLFLWFVRGMFSREILYAPGFCIGLGIIIGAVAIQRRWNLRGQNSARPLERPLTGRLLPVPGA